jgi:hypothetical protein
MEKKLYRQSQLIVKNVAILKLFGGCFRQEVQMSQRPSFIVVQNVITLGEITRELLLVDIVTWD